MTDTPSPNGSRVTPEELIRRVRELGPWHQNVAITETLTTGRVFSPTGTLSREENHGISLTDQEGRFKDTTRLVYPNGLAGKRVLDCACNAGAYSFWSSEMGADFCYGFDAREHWVAQARFLKEHRVVGRNDNVEFEVADLYELPDKSLAKFDLAVFKGIFYHLPDPIHALQIVCDLTTEVLFLETQTAWGRDDGFLQVTMENVEKPMSGRHGLSWRPTGPRVLIPILRWLGFRSARLEFFRASQEDLRLGRLAMWVARDPEMLEGLSRYRELMS